MTTSIFLTVLSGILWMIVYLDSIRVGVSKKTYAMPFWALALNIAWEGQYTILRFLQGSVNIADYVNAFWFVLDFGLLYTYIQFGRRHFPQSLQKYFGGWILGGLISAVLLQWIFLQTFGFGPAIVYSAFLQNLVMSLLFINMWAQRQNNEGQTLTIAISKWLGTLAATINFAFVGVVPGVEPFVQVVGLLTAVFDMVYIALVWSASKGEA